MITTEMERLNGGEPPALLFSLPHSRLLQPDKPPMPAETGRQGSALGFRRHGWRRIGRHSGFQRQHHGEYRPAAQAAGRRD